MCQNPTSQTCTELIIIYLKVRANGRFVMGVDTTFKRLSGVAIQTRTRTNARSCGNEMSNDRFVMGVDTTDWHGLTTWTACRGRKQRTNTAHTFLHNSIKPLPPSNHLNYFPALLLSQSYQLSPPNHRPPWRRPSRKLLMTSPTSLLIGHATQDQ